MSLLISTPVLRLIHHAKGAVERVPLPASGNSGVACRILNSKSRFVRAKFPIKFHREFRCKCLKFRSVLVRLSGRNAKN
jgi:hypothetical protein